MSFQIKARYGRMVVCDTCGDFGVIGDWDWREMRQDERGEPIHLCRKCRRRAVWCAAHQQYHLPDSMHRRPCVICGGLFTSAVEQQIEHCPQCRRNQPAEPEHRPLTLKATLSALLWHGGAKADSRSRSPH